MKLNEALKQACIKFGYPYTIHQGIVTLRRGGYNRFNKINVGIRETGKQCEMI